MDTIEIARKIRNKHTTVALEQDYNYHTLSFHNLFMSAITILIINLLHWKCIVNALILANRNPGLRIHTTQYKRAKLGKTVEFCTTYRVDLAKIAPNQTSTHGITSCPTIIYTMKMIFPQWAGIFKLTNSARDKIPTSVDTIALNTQSLH